MADTTTTSAALSEDVKSAKESSPAKAPSSNESPAPAAGMEMPLEGTETKKESCDVHAADGNDGTELATQQVPGEEHVIQDIPTQGEAEEAAPAPPENVVEAEKAPTTEPIPAAASPDKDTTQEPETVEGEAVGKRKTRSSSKAMDAKKPCLRAEA